MKKFTNIRLTAFCAVLCASILLAANAALAEGTDKSLNVFASSVKLPAGLKRVLVLPLDSVTTAGDLSGGCQVLDPVLRAALVKTGKFEVVAADPETLRTCTGKLAWTSEEVLP